MNHREATQLYDHRVEVPDRRREPRRKADAQNHYEETGGDAEKLAIFDAMDWATIAVVTQFFLEDCDETGASESDDTNEFARSYRAVKAMRPDILRAATVGK
jgi:hypothetical protein